MPTSILGGLDTHGSKVPSQWTWLNANPAFLQRIAAATPAAAKPMPNYLAGYNQAKSVLDAYNAAARTKPHNWWQSGYTTNPLPGWTPPAGVGNAPPPWSMPVTNPVNAAWGGVITPPAPVQPTPAAVAPAASVDAIRTMAKPGFRMVLPAYNRRIR